MILEFVTTCLINVVVQGIRLHFTIRFSIGDNVNVLSPSSKTRHTKFTRVVSF